MRKRRRPFRWRDQSAKLIPGGVHDLTRGAGRKMTNKHFCGGNHSSKRQSLIDPVEEVQCFSPPTHSFYMLREANVIITILGNSCANSLLYSFALLAPLSTETLFSSHSRI